MNYKISGGVLLILLDDGKYAVKRDDLFIEGNKIAKIGGDVDFSYETINADGMLIMPGLINMHTHSYMNLLKNYADDVPFSEWLFNRVMPIEDTMDREDAYWASMLGIYEMITSGTTCFCDMHMFKGQPSAAAVKVGMRAYIGRGLVGTDLYGDGMSRFVDATTEMAECKSELVNFLFSPHAIYSCNDNILRQIKDEAEKYGVLKQIHISESETEVNDCLKKYGKTPVEFLNDVGFLDQNTILAHGVKVTDNDIDIIKKSGASLVTNPASNAKLGNGYAPIKKIIESGINLCLGTDGASSNNTLNMFREMSLLSLLQKAVNNDCMILPSDTVLKLATVNAARALKRENELGVIKEGALADIIFLDLNSPSLFPNNNIVTSLVYSANGGEVSSVMINGKFVMKNREMLTIDTERLYYEMNKITNKYLK